jgi:hypothetical protein
VELTITGTCKHCRKQTTLHDHRPTPMPLPGDVVTTPDGSQYVVTHCDAAADGCIVLTYRLAPLGQEGKGTSC